MAGFPMKEWREREIEIEINLLNLYSVKPEHGV